MSEITRIAAPAGVAPSGRYSHVVSGRGRFVAVSGQVALDEDGKLVGEGDAAAQVRQVFANLERCLAAAGAGWRDVVKITSFLTDVAHLSALRTVWDEVLDPEHAPASSAVQVAALVRPEFLVEIEAFAVVPEEAAP
ncbi:RidA family protein [Kitasatospora sp. NPDC051914]|uniref:RidA family protein n=1 Tax=Kitasatospora sp. NPDC051914 TaxID=3154945 RepID=UPI00342733DD